MVRPRHKMRLLLCYVSSIAGRVTCARTVARAGGVSLGDESGARTELSGADRDGNQ
jgi:hypothetical protein